MVSGFNLLAVRADSALPLTELLRSIERQIADVPIEIGFCFDSDGGELARRAGTHNAIAHPPAEALTFADGFYTHNHPAQSFFSLRDLLFAHELNLRQLRAVAGTVVHILDRPLAGWQPLVCRTAIQEGSSRVRVLFADPQTTAARKQKLYERVVRRIFAQLHLVVRTEPL